MEQAAWPQMFGFRTLTNFKRPHICGKFAAASMLQYVSRRTRPWGGFVGPELPAERSVMTFSNNALAEIPPPIWGAHAISLSIK